MTAAHRSTPKAPAAFELKSAALTLICVVIKTPDLSVLAAELGQMRAETPGLFEQDPVVVDVSAVNGKVKTNVRSIQTLAGPALRVIGNVLKLPATLFGFGKKKTP
jgi:siroheme synthase